MINYSMQPRVWILNGGRDTPDKSGQGQVARTYGPSRSIL